MRADLLSRAIAICLVLAATPLVSVPLAHAQDGEPSVAELRRTFQDAIALEDQGKWAEALEKFKKVGEAKMTPQVRFHIAFAEENVGQLAAALRDYQEAEVLARDAGESAKDVLENAPTRAQALKKRVPTVKIDVRGKRPSFRIFLDGSPVASSALGTEIAVDPGKHQVTLEIDTETEAHQVNEFAILEGQRRAVLVTLPEIAKPEPIVPETSRPEQPVSGTEKGTKVPAIVVGSVGIASLVGAGVFLGLRQAAIGEVRDSCSDPAHDRGCNPQLQGKASQGRTYTYVSVTLASVGVAALATSAALWFTVGADKPSRQAGRVSISPGFVSYAIGF